ncbi:MAG TPA: zinc-ribbon and DUF3426 domain-containing protein [Steroidobacteraceae bacterium]|jgi:predicted Zn finger-like uncharacterized protein
MFTVCPKCALTLVVTAADLRVAQGYVRCGRCSSVFNALARLSERQAVEAEPAPAPQGGAPSPAPEAPAAEIPQVAQPAAGPGAAPDAAAEPAPAALPEESALAETALEFNPDTTDVNAVFVAAPPNPQWTAATGSFRQLVAGGKGGAADPDPSVDVEIDAAFLASMLDSEAPAPEARAAAPTVPAPAARPTAARDTPAVAPAGVRARTRVDAAAAPSPGAAPRAGRWRRLTEEEAIREAEELAGEEGMLPGNEEQPAAPHPLARFRPYAWPVGTAVAALLLVAQVVNHYRDELAASARFNHPLTALYGALGIPLFPRWDLRAYDVRQLGASGDAAGAGLITVRASIKNGASQPQPLPLLRVTLQDRFGNRIAARDVAPKAYLPSAMPASSFLSAGQRIDAQMGFADPGPDAVGFEIDACLPAGAAVIACANDAALR